MAVSFLSVDTTGTVFSTATTPSGAGGLVLEPNNFAKPAAVIPTDTALI